MVMLKGVRKKGKKIKDPVLQAKRGLVMRNELWPFVNDQTKSGSGKALRVFHVALSDDKEVAVVTLLCLIEQVKEANMYL